MNNLSSLKLFFISFFLIVLLVACGGEEPSLEGSSLDTNESLSEGIVLPFEDPERVVKDFYSLVSMGGLVSTREAYEYVDKGCAIDEEKFGELIKEYPDGFTIKVLGSKMDALRVLVDIEFLMPSELGEPYTVTSTVPLLIDPLSNSWKIDFTGESEPNDPMPEGSLTEGSLTEGSLTEGSLTLPHATHEEND
jgi:hypothetical protein